MKITWKCCTEYRHEKTTENLNERYSTMISPPNTPIRNADIWADNAPPCRVQLMSPSVPLCGLSPSKKHSTTLPEELFML